MQIRRVVLYSLDGEARNVEFALNKTNIITGRKGTGKSALIRIIEYCLGSGECRVPEGRIRDSISWYAVLLAFPGYDLFIARAEPGSGRRSSTRIYVDRGANLETPPASEIAPNVNTEGLIDLLTDCLGIATTKTQRARGSNQVPFTVSAVHAQFFTFLRQDEIAKPTQLFHRQDEEFIGGHIRDVLPYFLGAMGEDRVTAEQRLRNERANLRRLERELDQLGVGREAEPQAAALVQEALSVGLISKDRRGEPIDLLRTLTLDAEPLALIDDVHESVTRLQRERDRMLRDHRETRDRYDTLRVLLQEETGYAGEVDAQRARLQSIGLFSNGTAEHVCPLCEQGVSQRLPSVGAIKLSLARLNERLATVTSSGPRIERTISGLQGRLEQIRQELRDNQLELNQLTMHVEQLRIERDAYVGSARTRGRIDLFLETYSRAEDQSESLAERTEALRRSIGDLERELDYDNISEKMDSMLALIGDDLSRYAAQLDLEYKTHVRLDARSLTIIADTEAGPVPMDRMGSGANWVGYHLAAYAALHKWFERKSRPVPRFIFFDQPTQAFYPADADAPEITDDDDRERVDEMFRFLLSLPTELDNRVQVIVTDHASLSIAGFKEAVCASWHAGEALIPDTWRRLTSPTEG